MAEKINLEKTNLNTRFDFVLALAIIGILVIMVVPLPFFLLDILLALSLSLSVVIVLLVVSMVKPLDFSTFPTLLLVLTLFRLSLNIASTRLILLNGNNFDGKVIKAFGSFVVGGNYVVGAVIFLILVVIQFVVITKGAQRVAEVAARFTLDAMPGKQMAIDADLNAGVIDEKEAIRRRKETAREADFYGAMDGASKFVRGDAIAGIIITVINIIGGFIIGVLQQKMDPMQSLQVYGLLTIGDGLVTQIPALLLSVGAGIIVTRTGSDEGHGLGRQLGGQLLSKPKAVLLTALFLLIFGLIPGLPKVPFFVMAALVGFLGYNLKQIGQQEEKKEQEAKIQESVKKKGPDAVEDMLQVDSLELEIGYGLIPLADTSQGGDLLDKIAAIRRQCALELGIIVPPIRIRDNMKLEPNSYSIKLRGMEIAQGNCMPGYFLAMNVDAKDNLLTGIKTIEPAFGLPAIWISDNQKDHAESLGYTVVNAVSVVTTHLMEEIKKHAHEILGRQEVKSLLDNLKKTYPALLDEVVPNLLSIGSVQKVLQNLLRERIPIKDLVTILETLGDYGSKIKDNDLLTEYVRHALSRYISRQYQDESGKMRVITFDPHLEDMLVNALKKSGDISYLALEPKIIQEVLNKTALEVNKSFNDGNQPVILCSPQIRMHFKRLTERSIPNLTVLSFNEIEPGINLESIGMVEVV